MPADNAGIKQDTGTIGYSTDTGISTGGSGCAERFNRTVPDIGTIQPALLGDPHCVGVAL